MAINRELDCSLQNRVASPSPDFKAFLRDYFGDWRIHTRREEDRDAPGRLTGIERDAAIAMILANLRTGRPHIIDAAARLGLKDAVPTLEAMWLNDEYGVYDRFTIAKALHALGAMDSSDFYWFLEETLRTWGEFPAYDILSYCVVETFPPDEAQHLIDIGLRRGNYSIRANAYRAAVAVNYIRTHGGRYTKELAHQIWEKNTAAASTGTQQPDFYTGLQYYVGDKVIVEPALFEQRLSELWETDPKKRRVPLFTEIN